MCGLYSCRSAFLSYKIRIYVCPDVYMCIDFLITYTLVGGDVKGVLHNQTLIIAQVCMLYQRLLYYSRAQVLTRNAYLVYTDCGSSLRSCTTVSIEINITNFRKIFHYGVKIYHYEKLVGIRELSELFALDCLNNPFSTDTGTPEDNIPPLYEVDDIATVYTCRALYYSSYYYFPQRSELFPT